MTVLDELKQVIMATEGKFAADDFYHITKARGAHQSAVAKAFRLLRDDFCIKMVGHCGLDAGRDMLCYEVVNGAKFVVKERKERKPRKKVVRKAEPKGTADVYYQRVNLKEVAMNECGKRLESAMSRWV